MRNVLLTGLAAVCLYGAESAAGEAVRTRISAAELAEKMHKAGLDPEACYRVRDLSFSREDLRFYLTDGYLAFGRAVDGRIVSAVFVAAPEIGDAEVIVFPPNRSERASLAKFAETPNLDEHFKTGVFLFSDGTAKELLDKLHAAGAKTVPEKGALMAGDWNEVLQNLTTSLDMRLIEDTLGQLGDQYGLFYAAITGNHLGNFDVIYDPQSREQITIGKVAYRDGHSFFDIWTSFSARSFRTGRQPFFRSGFTPGDYRINAEFDDQLRMKAVTRLKVTVRGQAGTVLPIELARSMTVKRAVIDGAPVEIFAHESLRADLLRGSDNGVVLLVLDRRLESGRTYEVEVEHEGNIVIPAGNNVYFVNARTNWYPGVGGGFSTYDVTYRYPSALNLVANGEIVEDATEGSVRITRHRTSSPIRYTGFNLGEYVKATAHADGYTVEVYANRRAETALHQKLPDLVIVQQPGWNRPRKPQVVEVPRARQVPNSVARLQQIADDVSDAFEFMLTHFGPPPLKTLTVSPIPGTFGQGFPGLLYVSTLAYLNPADRPAVFQKEAEQLFYGEILHAHETAHQWWGNVVTGASYQDDWLMEALANYSALLVLEKRKGRHALDSVLQEYKAHLLAPAPGGGTIESAGPIIWSVRLNSSQAPGAWRVITYEKGSWILHMLRAQMGDAAFLKMLGQLAARYRFQSVSTEDFRKLAQEFMPQTAVDRTLEAFFEQWVYGTGVPSLNLSRSARGKAPSVRLRLTVSQSGVGDDFSTVVPVEVQLPGKRTTTQWIRTSSEPVTTVVALRASPLKVSLDPGNNILRK